MSVSYHAVCKAHSVIRRDETSSVNFRKSSIFSSFSSFFCPSASIFSQYFERRRLSFVRVSSFASMMLSNISGVTPPDFRVDIWLLRSRIVSAAPYPGLYGSSHASHSRIVSSSRDAVISSIVLDSSNPSILYRYLLRISFPKLWNVWIATR